MKKTISIALTAALALCLGGGCANDQKKQETVEPSPTKQPPQDVQPKMIDGKPVGFQ